MPFTCTGQLSEAQAQAAALQTSLEAATTRAQQAEERAAGLDSELAEARQSLEARQGELEGANSQLAAAQDQIAALTGAWGAGGDIGWGWCWQELAGSQQMLEHPA